MLRARVGRYQSPHCCTIGVSTAIAAATAAAGAAATAAAVATAVWGANDSNYGLKRRCRRRRRCHGSAHRHRPVGNLSLK